MKYTKIKNYAVLVAITTFSHSMAFSAVTLKPSQGAVYASSIQKKTFKYVPHQLLVVYKKNKSNINLLSHTKSLNVASKSLGLSTTGELFSVIKIKKDIKLETAMKQYKLDPNVKAVSYDYYREPYLAPNDPVYSGQVNEMWSLNDTAPDLSLMTGTRTGPHAWPNVSDRTVGNDIDAEKAWDVWDKVNAQDKANVVVAVIDSGVDYTHPDLVNAMWDGSNAPSPTLKHGFDAADNDTDPYPMLESHGTHVSGTIAATTNNNIGIPGIASGIKIMAIKVETDLLGLWSDSAIIAGINYAVANGADIINMSLGFNSPENTVFTTAVQNAVDKGVLLVIAAGNSSADNDITYTEKVNGVFEKINAWPSNYANMELTKAGVISVAATDQADFMAVFSSYGSNSVSLGAPGVNIKSTMIGNERKSGNFASGSAITFDPDPNIVVAQSGDATYPLCSTSPLSCFNNTFFSNSLGPDCVGSACQWGWVKYKSNSEFVIIGDNSSTSSTLYGNSIDGTITSKIINVPKNSNVILSFRAQWDLQCDSDYVDVEVFDGNQWVLLSGEKNLLNIDTNKTPSINCQNVSATNSTHTLTGHMGSFFKPFFANSELPFFNIRYNISDYSNPNLQVRFRFITDASINSTVIPLGVQIKDIAFITQVADYSNSYAYKSGTSMATPHIAGVAALVKGANPTFTGAQIKTAIMKGGDVLSALVGKTVSGKRVNAYNAISGIDTTPTSNTSDSGGCTLNSTAKFDPVFILLLLITGIFWLRNYLNYKSGRCKI
ncbi:MAG: S8 family serine peptidase [Thiohalomonadales bacterium]